MAHTWLHWGEWIIIWDFFFFELWLREHNMYAEQARWVESLSESLAFVPLAVETTTWVSHQTGFFLHLSTLPLLVELDMMKISTSLLGNKKSLISRMGVLAFLIWPFQAMEELPSFWPSEDPPGWSGWGKDSPFHLSTSSSGKEMDSEAVWEVPRCPWSSKHHLLPNAQRNWSGVQKSAVDRKRVVVCGECQPEKTRRVFPVLLPTGSIIRGRLFPPLQAPSPVCKWGTGLDTEVLNRDKGWLQGAEEFSVSEGGTKLPSERIHSFYWRLKAMGGKQGAQRASLGKDSKSHHQWRLLVLRKTQPKLAAVHVALFPGPCIFRVQGGCFSAA